MAIATLIFGYIFPYAGNVIPLAFIVIFIIFLFFFSIKKSEITKNYKILTGINEGNKLISIKMINKHNLWLLFFAVSFSLLSNITGWIAFEFKIKDINKKGLPVSYKEFDSPVPEGKNAAFLLEELAKKLPQDYKDKSFMIEGIFGNKENYPDFLILKKWTQEQKKLVRSLPIKNKYLQEYNRILEETDYYRFVDFANVGKKGILTNFPRFTLAIEFSRQQALLAKLDILEGNYNAALKKHTLIAKTSRYYASEKDLISKMVSIACANIGISVIFCLVNAGLPAKQALNASKEYEFLFKDNVKEGLCLELVEQIEYYRLFIKEKTKNFNKKDFHDIKNFTIASFLEDASGMVFPLFLKTFVYMEKVILNNNINETDFKKLSIWPLYYAVEVIPRYRDMYEKQEEIRFLIKGVKILAAAKEYYTKTGGIPESPEVLQKYGLTEEEIKDPLSNDGGFIKFKKIKEGLVIYSVGANRIDDNGEIEKLDKGFILIK